MKKVILCTLGMLALASISANADMTRETTTTTYSGTVSEVLPSSSTIVLRSEASAPLTKYVFNDRTVWVDSAGNTVKMETVQNQPVTVYYQRDGDQMVVTRVVTQKPVTTTVISPPVVTAPRVIEKKTTTTTTTDVVQ